MFSRSPGEPNYLNGSRAAEAPKSSITGDQDFFNGPKSFERSNSSVPLNEPKSNPPPPDMPGSKAAGFGLGSVIGRDLTIVGQSLKVMTKGALQVDGKIEGDVIGKEVIIGEKGEVIGIVAAEVVIVRGRVQGAVKGRRVSLHAGAVVEGDVHHFELTVEQGAHLDGRVRRSNDPAELQPDLNSVNQSAG